MTDKTKKIRVALVHDFLQSMGGAERVTLALSELYPEAPIYTLTYNPKLDKYFSGKKIITSHLQKWASSQNMRIPTKFLLPFYPTAIEQFDFTGFDVVISSSHSFAKNIITKPETLHISYIHSPMRYVWDTWHTYLKEQKLGRALAGTMENILSKIRIWDKLGSSRVDLFVANSQNVAGRIKKYYRRGSEVIYPPVDTELIDVSHTNDGYYLVVSRLSAYKRVDLAVQACRELNLPLVVIGSGEMEQELKKMAGPKTQFLGFVDDTEKIKYLRSCKALIFAGEEDFGIVPVEAMSAGKPVLAYRKGGLLETVVEGKTGVFFDDQSTASIIAKLKYLDAHLTYFEPQIIHEHAKQFSKANFKTHIQKTLKEKLNAKT